MRADAVIVAAGSSTRFGVEDKLLADLRGRPVIAWSLAAYEAAESIDGIVIVGTAENKERLARLAEKWAPAKFLRVVLGGARRRDSVEAGLRASKSLYVAIHDAARPLIEPATIDRCVAGAEHHAGAICAIPAVDTIKEVSDGIVYGHPDRSRLWAAQTPQVVRRRAWLDAAAAGDGDETDDAAMLARFGLDVAVVEGDQENIKITRPLDLEIARLILGLREHR
jgi:2-C-methyl-D-erythritol 4-phosphate cytidylyltransferase